MQNRKLAKQLNVLLSDYKLYLHKLLNYQWTIQAYATPEISEAIIDRAEYVEEQIDDLVSHVLHLGAVPVGNLGDCFRKTDLSLKVKATSAKEILQNIETDWYIIEKKVQRLASLQTKESNLSRLKNWFQKALNQTKKVRQQFRKQIREETFSLN